MPASIIKSKRRRYIRYAIDLKALLIIEELTAIDCRILDFCTGGFFLGLGNSSADISLNKIITVRFAIQQEFGLKTYEVNAKICRVSAAGVGVFVEHMPVATFEALKKAAHSSTNAGSSESLDAPSKELNQENFKHAFKNMLLDQLPILLGNFFETINEDLERANEHFELFENSSVLDDFVTTLKLNRGLIASEFCCSVVYQVDYISDSIEIKHDPLSHDSLALIEKQDFEDWLNMSAIIRKLNSYFDEELNLLVREFCRVFGRLSNADINNPISPAILCDSFREIILQLELSGNVKKTIYSGFGKTLVHNLPVLYKKTETILAKCKSASIVTPIYGYQGSRVQDSPKPLSQQVPVSQDSFLNPVAFSSHGSKQPLAQVTGKLLNILNETAVMSAAGLYGDNKESLEETHSFFNADEVLSAIARIQKNVTAKSLPHLDPSALQRNLNDSLKNSVDTAKSLSNADVHHLEVYGKFFETLLGDLTFSSEIKSYLESIYLPLLSLPLQGNDFLDAESHPVRNILNQLAVLEPAVKSNRVIKNINIKDTIEKAIARISNESISNPKVFAEVEHELDNVAKQVAKSLDINIKRTVEPYEGQQKLETARLSIRQEIDKRLAGKTVPAIIPTLLESGWKNLLVIAELNLEQDPAEKQKYLKVIDDLMFWFYEQESLLKMQSISIEETLKFIEESLGSVCTNLFQRDNVIEELTAQLLGTGLPKVRKPIETVKFHASKPARHLADNDWPAHLEPLRVGEWLMIFHGSQGFEPMKLVWIGDVIPICVFVNRDGLNKLEFNKIELADLLESGGASRIESLDAPLMERATNLMLQKMHSKLIYNATHDTDTDLLTRDEFVKQLKLEVAKLDNSSHMLNHIEVLDFRDITNICGPSGSKQFLKHLIQLIKDQLRETDLFGRLGDKSFAVLFKSCNVDEGYELSKKLVKIISDARFQWQDKSYSIGVSMGLVPFSEDNYDVNELLQHADAASMAAERSGQNQVLIFAYDDESLNRQNKLYEWIGNIDKVFSDNRLFLRCQMIAPVDKSNGGHQHYEILLGIKDENDKIIPPDQFIPAVERCKRMPEIDRWVIENVFHWIEFNKKYFDNIDGFAINLSGQSINSEEFLIFLTEFLRSSNVPTNKLIFEVTETVAAENLNFTNKFIATIKQFDCKFSLDDFGSGYSSYSYLKNLNIDYLKIDGAFVKDILHNKADIAIVKSMNEIAHSLGLATIAEYVENNDIRELLREIGVDYAQGYGVHKPMPLSELVVELPPETPFFSFEDTEFWGF
ncbi:DUF1631 family protein [Methylomonas sp. 2BW1-5-20]|uniref:DUF1631 family protein n=1 Tax=Methylomonas sp. 2BW1-5-20 TaxID=3376686 RepID=UPI004051298C